MRAIKTCSLPLTLLGFILVLFCDAPLAFAYKLKKTEDGTTLIWAAHRVTLVVNPTHLEQVPGVVDGVQAGFVTWLTSGLPVKIDFEEDLQAQPTPGDKKNVLIWVTSNWKYDEDVVAMTISSHSKSSGIIREADLVLNAVHHSWTTQPSPRDPSFDVQNVVTHEAGHFFGFAHSDDANSTMFASTPPGETAKQTLTDDDRMGILEWTEEWSARIQQERVSNPEADVSENKAEQANDDTHPPATGDTQGTAPFVGCSMNAQASRDITPLLLILAFWVVFRRLQSTIALRWIPWIGALWVMIPDPAGATTIRQLTLDQMIRTSDSIVLGRVILKQSYVDDGMVFTDYHIRVTEHFKGNRNQEVVFKVPGGELGDQVTTVEGVPSLSLGQEIIGFGKQEGAKFTLRGLTQGLFFVRGQEAFRDLRTVQLLNPKGAIVLGNIERIELKQLRPRQIYRGAQMN